MTDERFILLLGPPCVKKRERKKVLSDAFKAKYGAEKAGREEDIGL